MTSVTICITNYQSGDTVALCLESIRKFTSYPHTIMVYDDATNPCLYNDLDYLRSVRDKGWIALMEGVQNLGHGPALAKLIDSCQSDLAMILDCDIQITCSGWLAEMVAAQEKVNAAMVVDLESFPDNPLSIVSPFFMLDMRQYPHVKVSGEDWHYTRRPDFVSMDKTPNALYPTGYHVLKNCLDQGRPVIPIPASVHRKFFHHTHISVLSVPMSGPAYAIRQKRYAIIQAELRRLRASG